MPLLREIIQSFFFISQKQNPLVLMGDSNDVYNRLSGYTTLAGLKDASKNTNKNRTFPSFAPIWRLDRIYYSDSLTPLEQQVIKNSKTRMASDHLPLIVKLKL